MPQGCCISRLFSLKLYELVRNLLISALFDRNPSRTVAIVTGHITSEVQPQNHTKARPSGIMQIPVSINPNKNPHKGTLTSKPCLGRPRQSTLADVRQLLRCVHNGRTKSTSAPREEWQQPTNVLSSRWLINNRLVGGNLCQPEVNAITDIAGMVAQ